MWFVNNQAQLALLDKESKDKRIKPTYLWETKINTNCQIWISIQRRLKKRQKRKRKNTYINKKGTEI